MSLAAWRGAVADTALGEPSADPQPGALVGNQLVFVADDVRVELAFQWTESLDYYLRSYVNGIRTQSGGTHESGLNASLDGVDVGFGDPFNANSGSDVIRCCFLTCRAARQSECENR